MNFLFNSQTLIQALAIENASPQTQKEILAKLETRLQEVVLETLVQNISEPEARELRRALVLEGNLEEKVAEIAARIPGLADKLERAVAEEIERLRQALAA